MGAVGNHIPANVRDAMCEQDMQYRRQKGRAAFTAAAPLNNARTGWWA